jgi:hypothetical protein
MERMIVAYGHEIWDIAPGERVGMPPIIWNPPGTLNDLAINSQGVSCAKKGQKCDNGKSNYLACCIGKLASGDLSYGNSNRGIYK